ncbi:N-acetylmuramoyl-L-alanine amidase [Corynebacterium sp.]|uniref:N-acetylmuramoyl-L-alanine amidase n=1 Tax=Corynebacterium sp. TaxID=1720 RepID=UPI0026DC3E55|nr:N-acetylmuramoyl-L-alanine amidase [Corynebacterium sp.]MDO5033131.1 N-acetylmuramoyl-L-alanine amidase [Corynebacterium sp.]
MQLRQRIVPTKSRWSTPVIAAVTSISVIAAAALGGQGILKTQDDASGPIEVSSASESFAGGETVVIDDPAIAAQGEGDGPRAVKQFHRDEPFSMFAVTWKGSRDVAAFVRAKQADGSWSEWYNMDSMAYSNDDPNATNGTELIYVGDTNDVQVNVSNVDVVTGSNLDESFEERPVEDAPLDDAASDAEGAPADTVSDAAAPGADAVASDAAPGAEAEVDPLTAAANAAAEASRAPRPAPLPYNVGDIAPVAEEAPLDPAPAAENTDPEENADAEGNADSAAAPAEENADTSTEGLEAVFIDGNAQAGEAIDQVAVTAGMPKVVSRAGWGANENIRCMSPTYDNGVKALALHHTAGSNNYTKAQAAAQVRGIYQYHAQTLGRCDVGYNVLVDKYGTIYEGRYGGLDKAVQGAHIGGFNSNTWGISMIGNYETAQPTSAMLNSVAEIAGWKAAVSGFDPQGTVGLRAGSFGGSRYPAGATATVNRFFGHSDVHYTQCPGRYTIAQWPQIRKAAHNKYLSVKNNSSFTPPSWNTPGSTPPSNPGGTPPSNSGATSSIGGVDVPVEVIAAVAGIAATLFAIIMKRNGGVPELDSVAGVDATKIPGIVTKVVSLTGNEGLRETWTAVLNAFGPVLGLPVGGPDLNAGVVSQLFQNGVVLSSEDTGTHALVGEIAKAWSEGDNATKLGLPTSDEISEGKSIRVTFQGGSIVYDRETEQIHVYVD